MGKFLLPKEFINHTVLFIEPAKGSIIPTLYASYTTDSCVLFCATILRSLICNISISQINSIQRKFLNPVYFYIFGCSTKKLYLRNRKKNIKRNKNG